MYPGCLDKTFFGCVSVCVYDWGWGGGAVSSPGSQSQSQHSILFIASLYALRTVGSSDLRWKLAWSHRKYITLSFFGDFGNISHCLFFG